MKLNFSALYHFSLKMLLKIRPVSRYTFRTFSGTSSGTQCTNRFGRIVARNQFLSIRDRVWPNTDYLSINLQQVLKNGLVLELRSLVLELQSKNSSLVALSSLPSIADHRPALQGHITPIPGKKTTIFSLWITDWLSQNALFKLKNMLTHCPNDRHRC